MSKDKRAIKRALVLATTKPYTRHNLPEHTVASYDCNCGHKGAVQNGLANPHCSKCGTRVTAKTVVTASTKKTPSLKDCASTVSLLCGGCDTHNLMATATAMDFDGKTHCVSCGQGLEYDVADVVDEEDEVNLDNNTGADDFKGATTANDDEDDSIDDIDHDNDDEDDPEHTESSLDDDDEDIEDLASADEDEDEDTSEDDDFIGGDSADEPDEELGETEDDLDDESAMGDNAETPVLAMLSKKVIAKARLLQDGDSIHIFAGNHCVATARATKDNSKVFGTQRHLNLVQASLKDSGLQTTINDYGFTVSKLKITDSKKLKVAVANVQTDAKSTLDKKLKAQAGIVKQSLEIASLGFTRDAFSNEHANPLKDAVYTAFKALGVDHVTASVKTQKIFAEAGDEYAEVLMQKAMEIASMPAVSRTQLSQTFASMSVPTPDFKMVQADAEHDAVVASTQADNYFADTDNQMGDRLESPMRPSTTASVSRQQRGGSNAQLTGSALFSRTTLQR